MSGSIACYKVCSLISLLVKSGFEVKVAASQAALKFIGEATLEGLTGQKVYSDLWEKGHAMDHIHLDRWADLILAAPASSHFINRCATGIGDDLLTTLFLAHDFKKPFLVAPAMNTAMYTNPVTQKSISTLRSYGLQILEAASGVLACGETGYGRLLEPDQLFAEIQKSLTEQGTQIPSKTSNPSDTDRNKPSWLPRPKILVTAGGTREPLDEVRYLANTSTGKTGYEIASAFSLLGFDVTLNLAQSSCVTPSNLDQVQRFDSYQSLESLLKKQLSENSFDWIFHAAAVSDFSIEKNDGKISSNEDLTLHLKRNPKIINQLKSWSQNKNIKLVGFKLTSGLTPDQTDKKVTSLISNSSADFVVHNDTSALKDRSTHAFQIYPTDPKKTSHAIGVTELINFFTSKIGDQL